MQQSSADAPGPHHADAAPAISDAGPTTIGLRPKLSSGLDEQPQQSLDDLPAATGAAASEGLDVGDTSAAGEDAEGNKLRSACDNCSLKKIKCDGESPCQACRKRSVACHFSVKRPTGPKKAALAAAAAAAAATAAAAAVAPAAAAAAPDAPGASAEIASSITSPRPRDMIVSPPRGGGKRLRGFNDGAGGGSAAGVGSGGGGGGGMTAENDKTGRDGDVKQVSTTARGGVATRQAGPGAGTRAGRAGRTRAAAAASAAATAPPAPPPAISASGSSGGVDKHDKALAGLGYHADAATSGVEGGMHTNTSPDGWSGWQNAEDRAASAGGRGGGHGGGSPGTLRRSHGGGSPGASGGGAHGRKGGVAGTAAPGGPAGSGVGVGTGGSGGGVRREGDRVGSGYPHGQEGSAEGRTPSVGVKGPKRAGAPGSRGVVGKRGGGDASVDLGGRGVRGGRAGGVGGRGGVGGGSRRMSAELQARNGHGQVHGGKSQGAVLAGFDSTRALGERERNLLDVFLSTVNEFLPLINSELVMAMRKNVAADGTPIGSRKRRVSSAWSSGPDVDLERFARGALVNAALSVGALVTRDHRAAGAFADNARQFLKEIFDVPSEEAASAFLCLAYYNTYSGDGLRADL